MKMIRKIFPLLLLTSLLLMGGCVEEKPAQPVNGNSSLQEEEVTLYFSDADADYLVADVRKIQVEATDSITMAAAVIQELITGPEEGSELYGIMPKDTAIQSVEMEADGVLAVSFNQAFVENQTGGSAGMVLTLYGLVNSLTCLEGVNAVQILIDGEAVEAYQGLISAQEPVVPMLEYIQPETVR